MRTLLKCNCVLFTCLHQSLSTSLLSGIQQSRFTFYFPWTNLGTSHLSQEFWFLLVGTVFRNQDLGIICSHCYQGCPCFQTHAVDKATVYIFFKIINSELLIHATTWIHFKNITLSKKKSLKKSPVEPNQKPGVQPGPTEPNLEQLSHSTLSDL